MLAIIDYGVGNLFSLKSSFSFIGVEAEVTADPAHIERADKILLPGVGAFEDAMGKLRESGLVDHIKKAALSDKKPFLGICLGMQLLFDKSYEYGEHEGLGLIKGEVRPLSEIAGDGLKIPQIGWNALNITKDSPVFKYIDEGAYVYFVHSYYGAGCEDSLTATCEYGGTVTACVQRDNIYGMQFHPEKSSEVGLDLLRAFAEL